MTLFYLLLVLGLLFMANYVFGKLFPPKVRRGGLFVFYMVLGAAICVLLLKVMKSLFFVAIPVVVILSFLLVTRKR